MSSFRDPYIDPASGVMRNRLGITTHAELLAAEGDLVRVRSLEFLANPPRLDLGSTFWRRTHQHLFQDIYDWAGGFRTVDISKGDHVFQLVGTLQTASNYISEELNRAFEAKHLDREEFIARAVPLFSDLNMLHPFQEGNGRTQRVFWAAVAKRYGFRFDWSSVSVEQNIEASIQSADDRFAPKLIQMFEQTVIHV